jgi:hypothetical protein
MSDRKSGTFDCRLRHLVTVCALLSAGRAAALTEVLYGPHKISRAKPMACSKYMVQDENTMAVLDTVPNDTASLFRPKSGQVVQCKRHGAAVWIIVESSETLVKAVSPPIPGGTSSRAFVTGEFKESAPSAGGGEGGGGGEGEGGRKMAPNWHSFVREPSAHVILLHQYGDAAFDRCVRASGGALQAIYPDGDECYCVQVGKWHPGSEHVDTVRDLDTYLTAKGVAATSVNTFATLGHTQYEGMGSGNVVNFMKSGRKTGAAHDLVGSPDELVAVPSRPEEVHMTAEDFIKEVAARLARTAVVQLYHCHTGNIYRRVIPPRDQKDLAREILRPLKPAPFNGLQVGVGIKNMVVFRMVGSIGFVPCYDRSDPESRFVYAKIGPLGTP